MTERETTAPLSIEELVRLFNEQSDFERFPPRLRPAPKPLPTIAGDGCWCGKPYGHPWAGRDDGEPHPRDDFQSLIREAVRRQIEETDKQIEQQVAVGLALDPPLGVLVLVKHGVPWKCGPWYEVPAGEIHYREASSWDRSSEAQ